MIHPTRDTVLAAIAQYFPTEGVADVRAILDLYGVEAYERERERVQLGILKLSAGDIDKLFHFTDVAKHDYRDVLYWAEDAQNGAA